MDRKTELLNRTEEEWKALYESSAAEYYEDKLDFCELALAESEREIEELREENELLNRQLECAAESMAGEDW